MIAAFGMLGVKEALTYERARGAHSQAVLVGTALELAALQSVLLISLGALLIPLLTRTQSQEVTQASLIFLLFIPANLVAQYALGLLQGSLELPVFNALRISVGVVYLVALLLLWAMGAVTVWNVTVGLLVANTCTALLAVIAILHRYRVRWTLDLGLIRRIFGFGLRSHVGSVSSILNQRADQMLMAVLITPEQMGWYVVAVNVSSLARLPSGAFAILTFPKVAGATSAEQRRLTGLYSRLNAMTSFSTGLVLMLLLPFLISLVYGDAYTPSIMPAEILVVASIVVAIGQAWASSLRGLGRPSEPAKAELISLVVTVVGLALLLGSLGIVGAALTSLVAYLMAVAFMYAKLRQGLALSLRDLLWPMSWAALRERLAI
jgi:O-antigen/teichoic acid export membrane protein